MPDTLHFEVALVLLQQAGLYHLQLRNGAQQSGALGFIGGFGGAIEPGETAAEAGCRETAEESSVVVSPQELELLGEVSVMSEKHGKPSTVHATIFRVQVPADQVIEAREGELVSMSLDDMRAKQQSLSPVLRACVNELLNEEN